MYCTYKYCISGKYLNVSEEGAVMICVPSIPFKHSKLINSIVPLQAKTVVSEVQNS